MGVRIASTLDLLDALAAALDDTFNGDGIQVLARRSFTPVPPSIDMWPGNAGEQRDEAPAGFGDLSGSYLFTVRARVAAADHQAQQDTLFAFCDEDDPRCLAAALEADQTLDGIASSVEVGPPSEPIIYQDTPAAVPLLGVQWRVEVLAAVS